MQAIQNCVKVAFLYVVSIYAIQSQHYTMHIMLQRAWTRTPKAFKIQSWDIIIRHFVTSPFKTVHFQIVCKNCYDEVNGCFFYKTYKDEKQI